MKPVKIDKGVKKPAKHGDLLDKMDVGDSIFCDSVKERQRIVSLLRSRGFTPGRYPEKDGWRVFREE